MNSASFQPETHIVHGDAFSTFSIITIATAMTVAVTSRIRFTFFSFDINLFSQGQPHVARQAAILPFQSYYRPAYASREDFHQSNAARQGETLHA